MKQGPKKSLDKGFALGGGQTADGLTGQEGLAAACAAPVPQLPQAAGPAAPLLLPYNSANNHARALLSVADLSQRLQFSDTTAPEYAISPP